MTKLSDEYVGYDEAKEAVNAFMEASGLREICRKHCKGGCCFGCHQRPKTSSSRKTCTQNLACSAWLCTALRDFLVLCNEEALYTGLNYIGECNQTYKYVLHKEDSPKIIDDYIVEREIIDYIKDVDRIEKIRRCVNVIIWTSEKIIDYVEDRNIRKGDNPGAVNHLFVDLTRRGDKRTLVRPSLGTWLKSRQSILSN